MKDRGFNRNPERFEDLRDNPCWKNADLEDPIEDLVSGEREATGEEQTHEGFGVGLGLVLVKPYIGAEKTEEEAIEAMLVLN